MLIYEALFNLYKSRYGVVMKKFMAAFVIFILLASGATPVSAEEKRAIWDMDRLAVLPTDQVRALFGFSPIDSIQDDHSWIVDYLGKRSFSVVVSPCSSIAKIDANHTTCIEKVSYRKLGSSVWQDAVLGKVQLGKPTTTIPITWATPVVGPINFDEQEFRPGGDKATLWSMPGSPHSAGTDYLIRTKFISGDRPGELIFNSEIIPSSYPSNKGVVTQDQLIVEEFSKEFEYKLRIRMGTFVKALTGWFFGKLTNPTIDRSGPGGYLEIIGAPAFVPIGITNDVPVATADEFFDLTWCNELRRRRASNAPCGSFNRLYNKAFAYVSNQDEPVNLERWEKAPGGVRTIATLSSWSLRSSYFRDLAVDKSAIKCTTDLYGANARVFQGAVFSNASLFQVSPPSWDEGNNSFVFKVASPHLDERGSPNKGFYTLYIPTEIAKCRWGDAVSSARAEVQIISSDGKTSVTTLAATTQDGSLRFNIAGFGYSSPTIRVRMGKDIPVVTQENTNDSSSSKSDIPVATQENSNTPSSSKSDIPLVAEQIPKKSTPSKKIVIKCVKGKLVKKVVAVNPTCPKGFKRVST